mgnify:CR=1 FL=1
MSDKEYDFSFDQDDVFQGLFYMMNQNLLVASVKGTYFEPEKLKEISQKLGQYMFVLKSQSQNQKTSLNPQTIMLEFGKLIGLVLQEFD